MYIENYSILLDIKLILMTVQTMFKKESTEGFDRDMGNEVVEIAATSEQSTEINHVFMKLEGESNV